jgi:hypothetical protein
MSVKRMLELYHSEEPNNDTEWAENTISAIMGHYGLKNYDEDRRCKDHLEILMNDVYSEDISRNSFIRTVSNYCETRM